MSKIIIGIHGLGNKPSKRILEKWWKMSICDGLKRMKKPYRWINFKLVYWAHFLHPTPLKRNVKDKKDPLYIEYPYTPITQKDQNKKPSKLRKNIQNYLGNQLDKIMLNDDLSINFSSISDFIIHHFFSDLEIYYTRKCIRLFKKNYTAKEIICTHLAKTLKRHRRKKICLIAHSMGSIIAYDVLTQFVPDIEIDTLITIGSPLGLPIIKSKIASEQKKKFVKKVNLKVPENITSNWYDLSDLGDKIAFTYQLSDDYEPNSKGVKVIDKIVTNQYAYLANKNPHKSYGYLRTPEMVKIINKFLDREDDSVINWIKEFFK